jgi:hydrogenase nickel incorporation protein HypB
VRLIDLRGGAAAEPHDDQHSHTHPHPGGEHAHPHPHPHPAAPDAPADSGATETLSLETRVLAKNDELAASNREWLLARGVVAVNLMSSPGSGKTTLLERTVRTLGETTSVCVIEGDQETTFDAERIHAAGAPVLQVNTGSGCHLDAAMMHRALATLDPTDGVVLIENVGNLVCPALFDLGEAARVVIMSVTEGADKPLKYPHIFASATLVVLNKIDLLPYVDFDLERFEQDVRLVNPAVEIVRISATRGDGMPDWLGWLQRCSAGAAPAVVAAQAW